MTKVKREGLWVGSRVLVEDKPFQDSLLSKGFGGRKEGSFILSLNEVLYLLEKKQIKLKDAKNKVVDFSLLLKETSKKDNEALISFTVFKDLKQKGFVVKTGSKFGFPFRVYPKGKIPGQSHSKYVILILSQEKKFTMFQFTRAVRMASTLHTKLLFAFVDDENEIIYFGVERELF